MIHSLLSAPSEHSVSAKLISVTQAAMKTPRSLIQIKR